MNDDSPVKPNDITQHELRAMRTNFNLADAHTRQSQSPSQRRIVERLPDIWYAAELTSQHLIEERFVGAFFRSQRQPTALTTPTMLVYASSIAMAVVANFLALTGRSVSLIEPCFDNIPDLLRNMGVRLEQPLVEDWLADSSRIYHVLRENVSADALFIVEPNNPTGFTLEGTSDSVGERKAAYVELIRFAKDYGKLLIFDFCFAAFLLEDAKAASFDVYAELEQSGVSYITIEDTGKTWPLQDTKVAMLKTSRDLHERVFDIHTSYLLNVSPFVLSFVTEYILDSETDDFGSVLKLLKTNREIVKDALDGSILQMREPLANVSVAWFEIRDGVLSATELQMRIQEVGVYVLPGTYFYWSDPRRGERYIRIALSRDSEVFAQGVARLRRVLDAVESGENASPF